MNITVKYTIFAVIATMANIGSQDISLRLYNGIHAIVLSVLVGTAVGLVVKYVLDKKYIFQFQVKNTAHDTQLFILYAVTGVITTLIFWGFEFGFNYIFQSKAMRYTGGTIGLAIGYVIKYQLDKRFVFIQMECR